VVGFTIPDSLSAKATMQFLNERMAEKPEGKLPHVTVGGNFATVHATALLEAIPSLDSVVLYEGEETLCELVDRSTQGQEWRGIAGIAFRANGCARTSQTRARPSDLDGLPFPARDTLPALLSASPNAITSVISSRGCHRRCRFCAVRKFAGTWRPRSPANVVDELAALQSEFGVSRFDFQDDNFMGPGERGRQRALGIAEEIRRRRLDVRFRLMCSADTVARDVLTALFDAGLFSLFLGIESGSQKRLTAYAKGSVRQNIRALEVLDGLGILPKCEIGFIMFDPEGDLDEVKANLAFLRDHVRSLTPANLVNKLDAIYAAGDFPWQETAPPRELPEPLRLARQLFMLLVWRTRGAWESVAQTDPDLAEQWRSGALAIASHAVDSVSSLIDGDRLTKDSYRRLAEEVESRAIALSETITAGLQT
jgi:radical SAM superfamily enzyme YgiQ (UPF0313 family)